MMSVKGNRQDHFIRLSSLTQSDLQGLLLKCLITVHPDITDLYDILCLLAPAGTEIHHLHLITLL